MARVFIINDLNHDFDKAAKYGTLVCVTEGKVPIFKTDVVRTMVRKGLEYFDPTDDYLLVSGPAILCIMAVLEIVAKQQLRVDDVYFEYIKLLVFDAKGQDYVVRHVEL